MYVDNANVSDDDGYDTFDHDSVEHMYSLRPSNWLSDNDNIAQSNDNVNDNILINNDNTIDATFTANDDVYDAKYDSDESNAYSDISDMYMKPPNAPRYIDKIDFKCIDNKSKQSKRVSFSSNIVDSVNGVHIISANQRNNSPLQRSRIVSFRFANSQIESDSETTNRIFTIGRHLLPTTAASPHSTSSTVTSSHGTNIEGTTCSDSPNDQSRTDDTTVTANDDAISDTISITPPST